MFTARCLCQGLRLSLLFAAAVSGCAADDDDTPATAPTPADAPAPEYPRPARNWLEAQIVMARHDFSSGAIDGVGGPQSTAALRAYQDSLDLPITGALDAETREHLVLKTAPIAPLTLTTSDLAHLQPLSPTWLGKSQQTALDYENALQLVAERTHASESLIRRLNPGVDWAHVLPGLVVQGPSVAPEVARREVARMRILLSARILEGFDADGRCVAHFPVSIARHVDKRPVGLLHVVVIIPNPSYTFDPAVFPESPEARQLGRKLLLPPGPKNPVGVAWIGLDRPGYGIHGTPAPEKVGRTESHGCFRLANWDALTMLDLASEGLEVSVEP